MKHATKETMYGPLYWVVITSTPTSDAFAPSKYYYGPYRGKGTASTVMRRKVGRTSTGIIRTGCVVMSQSTGHEVVV